ncbi:hypothetical protein MMPV_001244 [Pyropia vietnamensis]
MGGCFSSVERGLALLSRLKAAVPTPPPSAAGGGDGGGGGGGPPSPASVASGITATTTAGSIPPRRPLPPADDDGTRQVISGCTVTRVADGDTVTVDVGGGVSLKVRLRGVDAPEKAQPGGPAATDAASAFCLGRRVRLAVSDVDHYGRTVGDVVLVRGHTAGAERSLGMYLLREGLVWHYAAYDKRPEMAAAAAEARAARRGVFADRSPEPPWEYRKRIRGGG